VENAGVLPQAVVTIVVKAMPCSCGGITLLRPAALQPAGAGPPP